MNWVIAINVQHRRIVHGRLEEAGDRYVIHDAICVVYYRGDDMSIASKIPEKMRLGQAVVPTVSIDRATTMLVSMTDDAQAQMMMERRKSVAG